MSAPSKEEIAPRGKEELVNWARIAVEHADHGDECKYRPLTRGQSVAMAKDIVALADENDRLRAGERALLMRLAQLEEACQAFENSSALANKAADEAEAETKRLRAERAECLALLEKSPFGTISGRHLKCWQGSADLACAPDCTERPQCWEHRRRALVAKLRGQQP